MAVWHLNPWHFVGGICNAWNTEKGNKQTNIDGLYSSLTFHTTAENHMLHGGNVFNQLITYTEWPFPLLIWTPNLLSFPHIYHKLSKINLHSAFVSRKIPTHNLFKKCQMLHTQLVVTLSTSAIQDGRNAFILIRRRNNRHDPQLVNWIS